MIASYTCDSARYDIETITRVEEIDTDMAAVLGTIVDTPVEIYKGNMLTSIKQGLAYSIIKNGVKIGFVYNRITASNKYYGCSINIIGDTVGMFLAMKTMFEITDHHKLTFVPHEHNIHHFKSMIHGHILRAYHAGIPEVTITASNVSRRGEALFNYLGIEMVE